MSIGRWIEARVAGICSSRSKVIARIKTSTKDAMPFTKLQLEDSWAKTRLEGGEQLYILTQEVQEGHTCYINDRNTNIVVVSPAEFVTVTDVAQAVKCERRGALSAIFKSQRPLTYPQYKGRR